MRNKHEDMQKIPLKQIHVAALAFVFLQNDIFSATYTPNLGAGDRHRTLPPSLSLYKFYPSFREIDDKQVSQQRNGTERKREKCYTKSFRMI